MHCIPTAAVLDLFFNLKLLERLVYQPPTAAVLGLCTSCAEQEAEVSILFKQSTTGGQAVLETGCTETGKKGDYKS